MFIWYLITLFCIQNCIYIIVNKSFNIAINKKILVLLILNVVNVIKIK